jgi:hypothetical protein
MVIDPLSMALIGLVALNVGTITLRKIEKWFHSKKRLTPQNAGVIGVIIAQKINERRYNELGIEFDPRAKTQLVKAMYNEYTGEVYEAEAEESWRAPDRRLQEAIGEKDGMLILR